MMQPHGFFNSSPAIDVPPSPGDLDDKENVMAVKPSQNGLIAKLWKYQKQRYSSSISLFMCLCLSISLLCKFECIMCIEFNANMHFCYPPVLIKQYTNIWKSMIDKMINKHHTLGSNPGVDVSMSLKLSMQLDVGDWKSMIYPQCISIIS